MTKPHLLPAAFTDILDDLPLEKLAFTAVPVQPRHDGWTPDRQRGFVLRLALGGCVSASARGVGMSAVGAYKLRKHPGGAGFARAWDTALKWGVDRTTDIALERALVGEARAVFYRGRRIGTSVVHDNRLAMAVLGRLDRVARLKTGRARDASMLD